MCTQTEEIHIDNAEGFAAHAIGMALQVVNRRGMLTDEGLVAIHTIAQDIVDQSQRISQANGRMTDFEVLIKKDGTYTVSQGTDDPETITLTGPGQLAG